MRTSGPVGGPPGALHGRARACASGRWAGCRSSCSGPCWSTVTDSSSTATTSGATSTATRTRCAAGAIELGTRLVAGGRIAEVKDVYFLGRTEALTLLREPPTELTRAKIETEIHHLDASRIVRGAGYPAGVGPGDASHFPKLVIDLLRYRKRLDLDDLSSLSALRPIPDPTPNSTRS